MDYRLLKTYSYQSEILTITPLLDNDEIDYYFKDVNTVLSDPLISNSIGGIKLMVNPNDFDKAILALAKHQYGNLSKTDEELKLMFIEESQKDSLKAKKEGSQFILFAIIAATITFIIALILLITD